MIIKTVKSHGYWDATVTSDSGKWEATGGSVFRWCAVREAKRKLHKAWKIRVTLADAVNIKERDEQIAKKAADRAAVYERIDEGYKRQAQAKADAMLAAKPKPTRKPRTTTARVPRA